jgi:hypothetical protein
VQNSDKIVHIVQNLSTLKHFTLTVVKGAVDSYLFKNGLSMSCKSKRILSRDVVKVLKRLGYHKVSKL